MNLPGNLGAPFDLVLDIGGNVGDFAELAHRNWPGALVVSFEPLPFLATANEQRAAGRWQVVPVGISSHTHGATISFCENQHSASSLQAYGPARRQQFGIVDRLQPVEVDLHALDDFLHLYEGRERVLIKIDVEGHERQVIEGAPLALTLASTVICEVQNDPHIFKGSAAPGLLDHMLRRSGLEFAGLAGCFCSPSGQVLQFDGIWRRPPPD